MTGEIDVRDRVAQDGNLAPVGSARPAETAVRPGSALPTGDPVLGALSGEPRVDAALRSLDTLPSRPVDEHPAVFEQVHASLVEVLGELRSDIGPADTGP